MTDAVQLSAVSKYFGDFVAVDGVSLSLRRGEFFSLLGPSGCGKSTMLRMIAGFEDPSEGKIMLGGASVAGIPANKRPTNIVFQTYAIFPHLNVENNVAFGLRRSGFSKKEVSKRVSESLEQVGLPKLGKRQANELSGGQRQRVALARALIMQPEVLLLDEPLSALDKKLREHMQVELRRLQRSVGITFLLVTHDQNEAMTISDRCGVMFNGCLEQVDTPTQLYNQPINRQVADFIGGMNFLSGTIKQINKNTAEVLVDKFGSVTMETNGASFAQGQRATVGVRPERLSLQHSVADATGTVAQATVKDIVFYGESIHYFLDVAGHDQNIVASVANSLDTRRYDEGDQAFLTVNGRSMVLLP